MNIEGLTNTFDYMYFNEKDVEKQICSYPLTFPSTRDSFIEWKVKLPLFVMSFYKYLLEKQTVPKQYDFCQAYFNYNADYFKDAGFTNEHIQGVKARIYRTYPSLVRDLHFGMMLKNSGAFKSVFYNETLDIEYGIDLVVVSKGNPLGP